MLQERLGLTEAEFIELVEINREMRQEGARRDQTPWGRFLANRSHARARNVEWKLTFGEWWGLWKSSGHWKQRGQGYSAYCLCRTHDAGAYEVGNVYIAPVIENSSIRHGKIPALPVGVQRHGKRFRVRRKINGTRYSLGYFDDPADAHAAYLQSFIDPPKHVEAGRNQMVGPSGRRPIRGLLMYADGMAALRSSEIPSVVGLEFGSMVNGALSLPT